MKSINDYINDFRLDARGVDTSQLDDEDCLLFLNRSRRDIINTIINEVDEDYYYEEWTINSKTVTGQREYTLPKRIDQINYRRKGCQKVKRVEVKYKPDGKYVELKPKTLANIAYSGKGIDFFEAHASKNNGFYMVKDNSIFIYPISYEDIIYGLIIYGISDLPDLVLDSDAKEIKIPLEIENKVTIGMLYHYYRARGETNLKNDAKNEWDLELSRLVSTLTDRILIPIESELPLLTHLR